jgi:hypothetical protein
MRLGGTPLRGHAQGSPTGIGRREREMLRVALRANPGLSSWRGEAPSGPHRDGELVRQNGFVLPNLATGCDRRNTSTNA